MSETQQSGKYRKKPVVIEAYQFHNRIGDDDRPKWLLVAVQMGVVRFFYNDNTPQLSIQTLEGTMIANPGDWIIKGVKGELYPCKPDIFAATYEPADLPTAALEGEGVREAIEDARRRFNVVKDTAYKLPNKCECSGSVACVTCQLLGDIGDLDQALSRIDAALAGGEKR